MVVLSLLDGEASPAEAAVVERFARALEIESKDLLALHHLAEKHLLRSRFDIARRFFAVEKGRELAREKGLGRIRSVSAAGAVTTVAGFSMGSYRASASATGQATQSCSTTGTNCTIAGLESGVAYSVSVVAINAVGTSASSVSSTGLAN